MITKDLIKLKSLVKVLLIKNLYARDNDIVLMDLVWNHQNKNIKFTSYNQFINELKNDVFFNPESIRRARQKVQELYPETRGIVYFERRKMQNEIKEILEQYKNLP